MFNKLILTLTLLTFFSTNTVAASREKYNLLVGRYNKLVKKYNNQLGDISQYKDERRQLKTELSKSKVNTCDVYTDILSTLKSKVKVSKKLYLVGDRYVDGQALNQVMKKAYTNKETGLTTLFKTMNRLRAYESRLVAEKVRIDLIVQLSTKLISCLDQFSNTYYATLGQDLEMYTQMGEFIDDSSREVSKMLINFELVLESNGNYRSIDR